MPVGCVSMSTALKHQKYEMKNIKNITEQAINDFDNWNVLAFGKCFIACIFLMETRRKQSVFIFGNCVNHSFLGSGIYLILYIYLMLCWWIEILPAGHYFRVTIKTVWWENFIVLYERKTKMTGETPDVRSDKRKPREERRRIIYLQDDPKMSPRCH